MKQTDLEEKATKTETVKNFNRDNWLQPKTIPVDGPVFHPEGPESISNVPIDSKDAPDASQEIAENTDSEGPKPPKKPVKNNAPAPKGKGRFSKKLLVIVAAAAVILLGAGASAYYGVYVPNKPENILKSAVHNSLSQQQISAKGSSSFENTKAAANQLRAVDVDFTAQTDTAKHTVGLNMQFAISGVNMPVELRSLDNDIYFKIGSLESIKGLASMSNPQLASLIDSFDKNIGNQWIVVDNSLLKQARADCLTNFPATLNGNEVDSLTKAFEQQGVAKINSSATDTVNGKAAIKYDLSIDAGKARDYAANLQNVAQFQQLKSCTSKFNGGKSMPSTDKLNKIASSLTVWVDKSSKTISQIQIKTTGEDGAQTTTKATLSYGNVNIAKPDNAKPLIQVLGEFVPLLQKNAGAENLIR